MAFVRTVKTRSSKGQIQEYLRIVENYCHSKNIKQIVNGLLLKTGEKPLVFYRWLRNEANKEDGVEYLALFMWSQLGLGEVVKGVLKKKKVELDYGSWIRMMVVNKLKCSRASLGYLSG